MQAQTPMAAPMQSSMPAPMQPPMQLPMQPPVPQPQAPAGIVAMAPGRTVPDISGTSSYQAQGAEAVDDLLADIASAGMDAADAARTGIVATGKALENILLSPPKTPRDIAVERILSNPDNYSYLNPIERRTEARKQVDEAERLRPFREEQERIRQGNSIADAYINKDQGVIEKEFTDSELEAAESYTGIDLSPDEILINQDALFGPQAGGGFSVSGLPSNVSSRVLTEDLSKLVNKEMSLDGVMSNLMLQTSDLPEIPDGADFSTIAEARAKRGEAASTRMEELVQSIQSKAKSDALNMALLNIGAGIAGGDLAGGLEKAGSTAGQIASDARKSAQALELQSITMAEEAARSGEDVQIQEALSDLQRFSVEQGIAKDQRDYNLNIIKIKSDSDLGFQRLASELAQSENISKRSVLGLIEKILDEEADSAKSQGEAYDAGGRALQLYNPFAGIFGLSALSAKELEDAQKQIGSVQDAASDSSAFSVNMRLPE